MNPEQVSFEFAMNQGIPGAMQLHLIPFEAVSNAIPLVNVTMAPCQKAAICQPVGEANSNY